MLNKKVLVVNGPGYERALDGIFNGQFGEFTHDKAEFMMNPDKYIMVLFSGGEDVSPDLYGHTSPKGFCYTNPARDAEEKTIFKLALNYDIPMVGICRGSQFLNVMSGGTMIHHLDGHNRTHTMRTVSGDLIKVTSTHHQMSIPSEFGYILAWSDDKQSNVYYGDKDNCVDYEGPEVEAIYYPDTKVFAVQYHPEYMPINSEGYYWFHTGVRDLLNLTEEDFKSKYLGEGLKSFLA